MQNKMLLGSPFEMSLRILLMMNELGAIPLDEQQMGAIDFIAVYGADFGILDENLHGYGSYRFSEFPARKALVSSAVKILVLDDCLNFSPRERGFLYEITESGKRRCETLKDTYAEEYKIALRAVAAHFDLSDSIGIEDEYMKRNFLLRIVSYRDLLSTMICSAESIDTREFMEFIIRTAHETKFKEEVIDYLDALAQEELGLTHPVD